MATTTVFEGSHLEAQLKKARALSRLGSDHLVEGKFIPRPGEYSSHHPYSKELYDRLPTLDGVVSKAAAAGTTMKKVLDEISNRLNFKGGAPVSASQVATRALAHAFTWQECSAPVAGIKWDYLPLPMRTYGMEVAYSPSLGYDASCAVLLQVAQGGWLGGRLINMREIEPGQLICITLTMDLSSIFPEGAATPVHLWVNKSRARTNGPGGNTPHLGVQGGSLFSLCALSLAPLGVRVDYSGRIFVKLLIRGRPLEVQVPFDALIGEYLPEGLRPLSLAGWKAEEVGSGLRSWMQSGLRSWMQSGGGYGLLNKGDGDFWQVEGLRALGLHVEEGLPIPPATFAAFGSFSFPKLTQWSGEEGVGRLTRMRASLAREARRKLTVSPTLQWIDYLRGADPLLPASGGSPFGGHLPFVAAPYRPRQDDLDISPGHVTGVGERALAQISKILAETPRQPQPELSRLREMAR